MRENWTDERLDDLNAKVDRGFERVDADLRALRLETRTESIAMRGEMKAGFDRVDERFDALHRLIIQVGGGLIGMNLVGFLGLLVSQL